MRLLHLPGWRWRSGWRQYACGDNQQLWKLMDKRILVEWRVAGYRDTTHFERFQRNQDASAGSRTEFMRVLRLSPAEFLRPREGAGPRKLIPSFSGTL
jgi:hypothetical protein